MERDPFELFDFHETKSELRNNKTTLYAQTYKQTGLELDKT